MGGLLLQMPIIIYTPKIIVFFSVRADDGE